MVFFACIGFLFILIFPSVAVTMVNILCSLVGYLLSIRAIRRMSLPNGVINLSTSKNYLCWQTDALVIEGQIRKATLYFNWLVLDVSQFDKTHTIIFVQSAMTTQSWRRLCRVSLNPPS
ncbi:protein YgfX [Pseudoalteromonas sp. MSK9-3]|uniref:protein YgfX n=1 Tax=Pseudoalteromonas sp. MSK9-3 TaxID=1897633 RepID=UPI002873799D|nr:protein YgfX [Pseudoalteromonas sp. MSK9-3]